MPSRRGFIGALLGSVGALAIDPQALLWRSTVANLPPVLPSAVLTMQQITREFLQHVHARIGDSTFIPGIKLGNRGNAAEVHQFGVDLLAPSTVGVDGLDVDRYIVPAATVMAQTLDNRKRYGALRGFGALAPPGFKQTAVVFEHGLSARGILMYDPEFDCSVIRFDMLAAMGDRVWADAQ